MAYKISDINIFLIVGNESFSPGHFHFSYIFIKANRYVP